VHRAPVSSPARSEVEQLQGSIQSFVRSFGLLVTKQTPCGQPVSPSYAHSLLLLREREAASLTTTQSELAALLGLDKSSVARLADKLEAAGHASREAAPNDGRSHRLSLTQRGARMAQNIHEASLRRFGKVLNGVPLAKRKTVLEALALLTSAVESLGEEEHE
jgi:DNA-binding MarR family transcriptional regulator